jgi:hypothetical protein
MISSPLYYRIIPQDRDRGYQILASWDKHVIARTAVQQRSLSSMSRAELVCIIADMKTRYSASEVRDVTDKNVQIQLRKMFGEEVEAVVIPEDAAPV